MDVHPLRILKECFSRILRKTTEAKVKQVQDFITLMKEALFKFYKIWSLKRSQDDQLTQFITKIVLDQNVSKCLLEA